MTSDEILDSCQDMFEDVVLVNSWGERGIFYNPGHVLKRGIYILTIKEKDGPNDKGSNLNRAGVYRVNFGIRKDTFCNIFGQIPNRPIAGSIVDMNYDFTEANKLLPHPVYAWMGWVCMLNPTKELFEEMKPFINESYQFAKEKFCKKII